MIDRSEIMEFSREFGLRANVVEKDYVLGWVALTNNGVSVLNGMRGMHLMLKL